AFAALAELSRNQPAGGDASTDGGDAHVHSAREYFHTYLQSLDVERAGLPESFQARLATALGHYGVTELARSPELEAAVFRIFLAQQRASADADVIAALLRAWLREPPPDETLRDPAGLALERLVAATQVRFPVVSDLARGVVFAWFAQPLLRRNRARVYAGVRKHLRHLDAHPDAPDRAERIAEMVRSTEPLVRLLGQRLIRQDVDNAVMLEVLTRRYYGNKGLTGVRTSEVAGCTFVVAERSEDHTGSCLVSAAVSFEALGSALRGLAELASGEDAVVADIYLAWENQPEDSGAMAAALHEVVSAHPLPNQVRRLTTTVAGSGGAVMHHHFTFRPSTTGMTEERLIRGLHPYIAQRMQLERLRKFDLTRLPSSDEEIYLFQCVARENPSDNRLVAFAQVRDLTELREHDGRLVALPTAEDAI
ncbi:MAG: fused acetyl/propionyl-CoA carboxylase subunit alpha/methylmalonyl-CoA decarboxylase subunit alpha, partial [Pseudonocardiaceae bacterium]|nr:fused acetyl/propionyl-CoA carboxylase subunit alpha/methylmalonyl-CoA decarboxylase subunit alpha [Pseudonocardiaceae bacterium]